MAQWKIWIGDVDHQETRIVVPATLRRWRDDQDPETDEHVAAYDISEQILPNEVFGMTIPQVKQLLADKVIAHGDALKNHYDIWIGIQDQGNRYLPGWPS